jgi:hypothetical protein
MIEIEKYSCNDSNEASARERYWVELLKANLNMNTPSRTRKERYNDNKEKLLEYQKEYRIENKDVIKEKNKEYKELNKEVLKEKAREKRELNKDEFNKKRRERYALKKGITP